MTKGHQGCFRTGKDDYVRLSMAKLGCLQMLKVPLKRIFYGLIFKSFQNDEEWRLFYCDSTLSCRVIQDVDLCKLDEL